MTNKNWDHTKTYEWAIRGQGVFAHWGGITFGPERMTQLAPSSGAVIGMLRTIFSKNEYRWRVQSVGFLKKPQVPFPITSNEYQSFDGRSPLTSTQRTRMFLKDIDIVIRAQIEVGRNAGPEDTHQKAVEMISRRLRQGYRRHRPYFGIAECLGDLTWVEDESTLPPLVEDYNVDLGMVFYDFDRDDPEQPAYLAPLRIEKGLVKYPSFKDVRKYGIRYHAPKKVA